MLWLIPVDTHSRGSTRAHPRTIELYEPEYCELAHNYCLLGATNEILANFFDVALLTVDNWVATHSDFADAVYRGCAVADAVVGGGGEANQMAALLIFHGGEHAPCRS